LDNPEASEPLRLIDLEGKSADDVLRRFGDAGEVEEAVKALLVLLIRGEQE
jgi:hypothetical protein